jgi:hypothetical protein
MRRVGFIAFLFVLAVLFWAAFEMTRLPPGLEPKGTVSELVPWISLAGATVSLASALITLMLKLIELKRTP